MDLAEATALIAVAQGLRAGMAPDALDDARSRGAAMSTSEGVALALNRPTPGRSDR